MIDTEARRRLRETIAALSARTTDRGCTEAEALAAAEKVAELLSKHGVVDPATLEFDEARIEIGRRTVVDELWPQVAVFCHCKLWLSGSNRKWAVVYFGRWNDVLVAEYLHALLERHLKDATREWQRSHEYRRRRSPKIKREATKAFQQGLVHALRGKLWSLQWRCTPKVEGTNHQALVLSPLAAVEEELNRRGMQFGKPLAPVKGASKKFDDEQASGRTAARDIDINAAVAGGRRPSVAGLLAAN
ncbi:hypothetical protein KL86APRO_12546 [uncultured Alphaproteobacteria bacterium]|uniref:Uncharacterized protein n=1 Tax=uncultured Alphaproteobacteria bacterium TaxID=91750 RepID=A0A212KC46_9PROT|nr:hypothetical protein KL86APRO_12546 [uncultured Alphaproteobacteria bacterium]